MPPMRDKIVSLLDERGEMTFADICWELKILSRSQIDIAESRVEALGREGLLHNPGNRTPTPYTVIGPRLVGMPRIGA